MCRGKEFEKIHIFAKITDYKYLIIKLIKFIKKDYQDININQNYKSRL